MKHEYRIITAGNINDLIKRCEELMSHGFKPTGGVSEAFSQYIQAFIREKKEDYDEEDGWK